MIEEAVSVVIFQCFLRYLPEYPWLNRCEGRSYVLRWRLAFWAMEEKRRIEKDSGLIC